MAGSSETPDTQKFKTEIQADTQKFKEKVQADTEKFKEKVQADTEKFKEEVQADTEKFKEEVQADTEKFKEEIRADTKELKEEMKASKDEIRADTKRLKDRMDKKWGELSNKMGTLVEDMVAPNVPTIVRKYFKDPDFDFFGVRIKKRKVKNRSVRREFDVVAISDKNFFVCEVKSKPSPESVGEFVKVLPEMGEYFPESRDKRIIPIFSSLHIPEDLLRYMTRHRIYAMGFGEETMDLLNFEEMSGRET